VKSEVRKWVGEGRWEFVGGGWVMHDESLTHIVSAIDQIALGHEFLYQHFDVRPTVAWQLDPVRFSFSIFFFHTTHLLMSCTVF
jgi:alpha-mannosidase